MARLLTSADIAAAGGDPAARVLARPANNVFAQIGDSQIAYDLIESSAGVKLLPYQRSCASIQTWAEGFAGLRVRIPAELNFAVAGSTTGDILSGQLALALASNASNVAYLATSNDFGGAAVPLETTKANTLAIVNTLLAAGKTVWFFHPFPRNGGTVENSRRILAFGEWTRTVIAAMPGVILINAFDDLADPLSTDAAFQRDLSNYKVSDGSHINGKGAFRVGRRFAEAINVIFPPRIETLGGDFDRYHATDNPTGNLINNGMLNGTGGSGGAGNNVASGWAMNVYQGDGVTVTPSKGVLADGSMAQRFVVTGTGTNSSTSREVRFASTNFNSDVASGDVLEAVARLEVAANPGFYNALALQLLVTVDGVTHMVSSLDRHITSTYMPQEAWSLPIRTPKLIVPPGSVTTAAVRLSFRFPNNEPLNFSGGFGRVSARKLAVK